MSNQSGENAMKRGLVKQVLSGDSLVLQGPPSNGPPKELTIYLGNCSAPRLAKRPTDGGAGTSDEPYAWEAREYLRKKIVGKTVVFIRDFTTSMGREHGRVYFGGTGIHDAENIGESAVREGWLEVRTGKQIDEQVQKLVDAQEQAKAEKKGRWSGDAEPHVRSVVWNIEDPRKLVEQYAQKSIDAIVEQVRDGNTVRAFLLPTFEYVTIILSGIKAPSPNRDGRAELYGDEAKFFVETRLLQRDVKVILSGVSNANFVGSVIHPRGDIAEFVLRDGLAKCVEWSLGMVAGGPQKLRDAERYAKDHKLRLWHNYVSTPAVSRSAYTAKVIEIGLGDSLTVQKDDGKEEKIYLSSIRPPRREGAGGIDGAAASRQFRPLYDIPHMFAARELLRQRIVGHKVHVVVDYVQPKSDQFAEKTCCTVTFNNQNLATLLVQNGLAKVVRHKQDDDNRSRSLDELLAAEATAEKEKKGLHDTNADPRSAVVRVQELQGDVQRSKQFMPYLSQRAARSSGIVEFVASGSRLRVYVPKETCVITFLLGGINCPRGARTGPSGKLQSESEPFADEALRFTRSHVLQHEVQIEVESLDKAGNFIGNLFVRNDKGGHSNLAEMLIENGLASVHFTAERSKYYAQLLNAEEDAKRARRNLWRDYVEPTAEQTDEQKAAEPTERKLNLKRVAVSEVYAGNLHFAAQNFADAEAIEKLMKSLQNDVSQRSEYSPKRNDICACMYHELNLWHRARIESLKAGRADVLYIDFGNRENVELSCLAPLPTAYISQSPLCHEYKLAFVALPNDKDLATDSEQEFREICFSAPELQLNAEYKVGNIDAVSLFSPAKDGDSIDVGKHLVADGLALVEQRREARFKKLMNEYQDAEKTARSERRNMWRYGDFTGTEAN